MLGEMLLLQALTLTIRLNDNMIVQIHQECSWKQMEDQVLPFHIGQERLHTIN